ncbi:hypothetical protein [Asanoa iriomotensis]|uniref:DUF4399 domain-containing protein n=1 Tax=Asanoa iriomotensis TaxID=234613 RepID=A0ABQ4CCL2_9ACTN|nr:hypothetical protein [Asanoa iriomotensis]GIF60516.1 hypothetical protein Air01nite_66110 [Asanoa iriomotensis]
MTSGSGKARRAAEARKAVEAQRKRERRRRHLFTYSMVGLVVLIVAGVVLALSLTGSKATASGIPKSPAVTAEGAATQPPWSAPTDATARVAAAGLPMLGEEGNVEHIHAHLDVIANGQAVSVPADIGIDATTGQLSPLHTHDTSGVVHVESPVKAEFSLGQLFTEWNVSLSADHVGGLRAGDGKVLQAYVNGKAVQGDPAAIVLHAHDEIALVYGTAAQQANPPASYSFPAGL